MRGFEIIHKKAAIIAITVLAVLLFAPLVGQQGTCARAQEDVVQKALDYLRSRQQPDGGFAEPGRSSSEELTAWVVTAIASTGESLNTWVKSGKSPLDFLASNAGNWTKLTDVERTCLAAASAGADPRSFAGRNLVAEISSSMAGDGHIGEMINDHCWGVIALEAAGEAVPDGSRGWLAAQQNIDGGFGFAPGEESEPDDTGAALQALMASGEDPNSSTVQRALEYLRFSQADDGGFYWQSTDANTGSTAWAVQGIAAAGDDPASEGWSKNGSTPVDFLGDMQASDGHIRYSRNSDTDPCWMTSEAIPALLKRPYPLNFTPPGQSSDSTITPTAATEDTSSPAQEGEATAADEQSPEEESGAASDPGSDEQEQDETGGSTESCGSGSDSSDGGDVARQDATNGSENGGGNRTLVVVIISVFSAGALVLIALGARLIYTHRRA